MQPHFGSSITTQNQQKSRNQKGRRNMLVESGQLILIPKTEKPPPEKGRLAHFRPFPSKASSRMMHSLQSLKPTQFCAQFIHMMENIF